jgi:hypothetical protein
MFKIFYRCLLVSVGLFFGLSSFAQENNIPEQGMRSNGKIYVVMAVCLTILTGLIIYLVSIDRKIGKWEDKQ